MTADDAAPFPEIMCPEVQMAFEALARALDTAAQAAGVTLCDVAVTWHARHGDTSGYNCIFGEGMTAETAEAMAAVLMMDADEAEFEQVLPPVVRQ